MTCYERLATLRATGQNMAAADTYEAKDINWTEVHYDFGARRVIECAYMLACAERKTPTMVDAWRACGDRMARRYFPHEVTS